MSWAEEDYLLLSGLQHFAFCPRQWALIHIENQWADNTRTVEGKILHERAHDNSEREKRGDTITVRSLSISSSVMGVSGQCDVVEFHADPHGISIQGEKGTWLPYPIEYKRGSSKDIDADRLQLCGQAMCLEEMLCCSIPDGALFYGEQRRRENVIFSEKLRQKVKSSLENMHQLYKKGYTPRAKASPKCNACSLKELCLPKLTGIRSVKEYITKAMEET